MIRINEFFCDNLWRWKCGMQEISDHDKFKRGEVKDLEQIRKTHFPKEWNEIHTLADNRILQGSFRYGPISEYLNIENSLSGEIQKRLDLYKQSLNLEHLVDIYNWTRIEYFKAKNQGSKLTPIDDGHHFRKS